MTSDSTEVKQIYNLLQQKELEIKTKEAENIYLKGFLLYSNTVYYYIMSLFEDDENLSISNNGNDLIVENSLLSSNDLVEKDLLE
ncbi:10977_t:CDS:2, partial [Gigaspora rosea]